MNRHSLHILVLGGAGFIGSHFVEYALKQTNSFVVVVDNLSDAPGIKNLEEVGFNFENFYTYSIEEIERFEDLVLAADLVVNFASQSSNDQSLIQPDYTFKNNSTSHLGLLSICAKEGIRYHHVSTDEVYGDLPINSTHQFDEHAPLNPSSPYSAGKAAGDLAVLTWTRNFGLRSTISRSSNNYGTRQSHRNLIPKSLSLASQGLPVHVYGDGTNVRDWIHVRDNVEAIYKLATDVDASGVYNISVNYPLSNLEIVKMVLEVCPENAGIIFVEDRVGHDRRYGISSDRIWKHLGWAPDPRDLGFELSEIRKWLERS